MDGGLDFALDFDADMEKDRRTRLKPGLLPASFGFELPLQGVSI